MPADDPHSPEPAQAREFLTTHWSVVLKAANGGSPDSTEALELLCRSYWQPLYVYVRRLGFNPEDAQDLTQAFFERLLEKGYLAQADRERGRFRSFLLASLRHFVSDEMDRVKAWKRGGRAQHVPLDPVDVETQFAEELDSDAAPEHGFDRAWAWSVMGRVQNRLRDECSQAGRSALHDALAPGGNRSGRVESYEEIGARLGLTEGAVKLAAFRLRQRYRDLIRDEVAQTVRRPEDLEDEIRHLLSVLSAG